MHTIKITHNLLFEYQCTSGKFIRLPNRIESKKIDSVERIECNRIETFFARIGLLYLPDGHVTLPDEGRRSYRRVRALAARPRCRTRFLVWKQNNTISN